MGLVVKRTVKSLEKISPITMMAKMSIVLFSFIMLLFVKAQDFVKRLYF